MQNFVHQSQRRRAGRGVAAVFLALLGTGLIAPTAESAPLPLVRAFPDINASSISISYNATTDLFTATGSPLTYATSTAPADQHNITGTKAWTLTANVDANGILTGGSPGLSITGGIPDLAIASGSNLLGGNFFDFGFLVQNSGGIDAVSFQFLLNTDPARTDATLGYEKTAGIIMSGISAAGTMDFTQDFNLSAFVSDTFRVPVPSTLSILLLGGLALVGVARRRTARAAA